jgi:hypothetical protein
LLYSSKGSRICQAELERLLLIARLLRKVKRVLSEPSREDVTSTTTRAVPAKPLRKVSWREAVHLAKQELYGNMALKRDKEKSK